MKLAANEEKLVNIDVDGITLEGALGIPEGAEGIVLFAHGSGSSRHSPRNNYVAQVLRKAGVATLLMDLLTREEDVDYSTRFDIGLLTARLEAATRWLEGQKETKGLVIGYFGASTGAAAALKAAVSMGPGIGAVVSRGGRTDMASQALPDVKAPTLFIVGGDDDVVLALNRQSLDLMSTKKELKVIPGASHLFEEPGALEEVAALAANWFKKHLTRRG
ncbi:MAG TPA: dienelactone hydrolase family protein [Thermodesulfobacteriota bacterium]|nr:dienelactone hydrolase family protein [Thermodesulfobacteriota bacterium]